MARPLPLLNPALSFAPETLLAAQGVRVVFFDVDGVLTDGGVYFSEQGETLKRFSVLDGYGLQMLPRADMVAAVITGRDSKPLRLRLQALGVVHARYGVHDKLAAAQTLLAELQLDWPQAAVIGDDWPDLPLMRRAAFTAAPPNAHAEVRALAMHITQARGGEGAARELCDLLTMASGHYRRLLDAAEGAST